MEVDMKKIIGVLIFGLFVVTQVNAEVRFVIPVTVVGDLTGYQINREERTLSIFVLSNGCLDKTDFQVTQTKSLPPQVTILQKSRDFCKRVPFSAELTYTFEELGVSNNSIQVYTESAIGL
jgi:hypothetical protein